MTNETERELSGFEEAKKMDAQNSNFFDEETNIEYTMSYSAWKLVEKTFPQQDGTIKKIPAIKLTLETVDGKKTNKTWDITAQAIRKRFQPYCEDEKITKGLFKFKRTGDGFKTDCELTWLGPKEGGETIVPEVKA